VGRSPGELQFTEQVVEEVGEAEPPVRTGPVELRQGDEEVCEGDVLAAEKAGETAGGFAHGGEVRVVHGITIPREFWPSPNAREFVFQHSRERGPRTPPDAAKSRGRGSCEATGSFLTRRVAGT
jgi:hypothetical protein